MDKKEEEVESDTDEDSGLAVQDLATLKIEELTPLTPAVISRQATINIGIVFFKPFCAHSVLIFLLSCLLYSRNHWSCGAWKVDCSQGDFRSAGMKSDKFAVECRRCDLKRRRCVTLPLSWDMRMRRYTNVTILRVNDREVIRLMEVLLKMFHYVNVINVAAP